MLVSRHMNTSTMTSQQFVFFLTYVFLGRMALTTTLKSSSSNHQESVFLSAQTGATLTLQCFYDSNIPAKLYWYKQILGQKPKLVSTSYSLQNSTLHDEFKNDPRFTLDTKNDKNHLTISKLRISDSATYSCLSCYLYTLEILESTTVNVKGSGVNIPALVYQSPSESIQPGGSVTLNCTVHTGSCDGEHTVYWFKHSEESHPGLIYTHGGRNDQCERKANTQTHTCVYNLPVESLNLSHAGTYYCAVASCGHILFGDGIKLDLNGNDGLESFLLLLVYILSGALTVSTILSVSLAFSIYIMKKRNSTESQPRFPASTTAHAEGYEEEDNLHYAALSVHLPNRSRRQRNTNRSECVYSSVKH